MKIVFFGTPEFVSPVLESLKKTHDVILAPPPRELLEPKFTERIKSFFPDLFVVAAYGKIIPREILEIPKYGAINIHPSLLPKYRGASPIQQAILEGDKKTGVTYIKMDEQMDHGPIIEQFEISIDERDTFESLAKKAFQLASEKLPQAIDRLLNGTPTPQNHALATECGVIKKEDGFIDLDNPPRRKTLEKMVRAYHPWPGVWTRYRLDEKEIIVKLLPHEKVQVEGKLPVGYKDFLNGYKEAEGFLSRLGLTQQEQK